MATSWYDPTGSNAGFYNSPEDFLFKSQGGTWYGQGPSGQKDAAKMPTMAEYYFGGPTAAAPAPGASMPAPGQGIPGSMSEGLPWAQPSPARVGGGGHINLGNNVSVPQGPLWQRYQALQANPAMLEADPAYRYMLEQGEEALSRSAGARRKRFSGETMLDFQRHAQGQAATNLRQLLPELRAGAQQEFSFNQNEAQAQAQKSGVEAFAADPYGHARNLASKYRSINELYTSPEWVQAGKTRTQDQLIQRFMLGQRLAGG